MRWYPVCVGVDVRPERIAAAFFVAFLAFVFTRRPRARNDVNDSGLIPRGGPPIPWNGIENVTLGESGRGKHAVLAICVRPSEGEDPSEERIRFSDVSRGRFGRLAFGLLGQQRFESARRLFSRVRL